MYSSTRKITSLFQFCKMVVQHINKHKLYFLCSSHSLKSEADVYLTIINIFDWFQVLKVLKYSGT